MKNINKLMSQMRKM